MSTQKPNTYINYRSALDNLKTIMHDYIILSDKIEIYAEADNPEEYLDDMLEACDTLWFSILIAASDLVEEQKAICSEYLLNAKATEVLR